MGPFFACFIQADSTIALKFLRAVVHPGRGTNRSHHQKFVVVDRAVAIQGGIDWTISRWDNTQHNLFDPEESNHPGTFSYFPTAVEIDPLASLSVEKRAVV